MSQDEPTPTDTTDETKPLGQQDRVSEMGMIEMFSWYASST